MEITQNVAVVLARSETAPVAAPVQPPVQPPRAKEPEVKSPQEPRPGTGGVEKSAPRGPQPTAYLRPVPVERGASKLLRKPQQSEGKGQTRDTPPPANGKEQARP